MTRPRLRSILTVCLLLLAVSVGAQEVLTNDAVIAMKKAGLSDGVILAKIRSSQSKFDVSTKALVDLKTAGLSDPIIEAMLGHSGPAATAPSPVAPGAPQGRAIAGAQQGQGSIFHLRGEHYIELSAAVASLESNFAFFASKSEIVLKGRKAAYRVTEQQPVFVSAWAPNEAPLIRLKPGSDHDDRNLKFSSGSFNPFGGSMKQGVRTEDIVDVESEKDPRGLYRIKPRQPLPPGEYGFILTHGVAAGAGAGGKIYDFGVD